MACDDRLQEREHRALLFAGAVHHGCEESQLALVSAADRCGWVTARALQIAARRRTSDLGEALRPAAHGANLLLEGRARTACLAGTAQRTEGGLHLTSQRGTRPRHGQQMS